MSCLLNCLLNYEQLKVSSTAVICIYLCVEDVYCLSLTLLVSGMYFEKTDIQQNITLQKEILHLRMSVKQELWLGKELGLTVKFKLFFCLLMLSLFNACHLHSVSF